MPRLEKMRVEVQLVTSAVTAIPRHWANLSNLRRVVSVDGLQPEHDRRRTPATYDRIIQNIAGHTVIIPCTVTKQMLVRTGYLADFCRFWCERAEARKIWFSLFTPQEGAEPEERLSPAERQRVIGEIAGLRPLFPKLYAPEIVLKTSSVCPTGLPTSSCGLRWQTEIRASRYPWVRSPSPRSFSSLTLPQERGLSSRK